VGLGPSDHSLVGLVVFGGTVTVDHVDSRGESQCQKALEEESASFGGGAETLDYKYTGLFIHPICKDEGTT
jgi:hypothetical protein